MNIIAYYRSKEIFIPEEYYNFIETISYERAYSEEDIHKLELEEVSKGVIISKAPNDYFHVYFYMDDNRNLHLIC